MSLSVAARDLEGLSRAYRRAEDYLRDRPAPQSARPAKDNWEGYIDYADQTEQAAWQAATRFAEVERQLAALDASTRAYVERSTTPEERSSLVGLMDTVMRLQREARVRHSNIENRAAGLRSRLQSLSKQLASLENDLYSLRANDAAVSVDLAHLQTLAAAVAERVIRMETVLADATDLAAGREGKAATARARYWTAVDDLFARQQLGSPRDYTPRVTAAAASTQRRVHHSRAGPILQVPPLVMSLFPESVPMAAAYALPLPRGPLTAISAAKPFNEAVDGWLKAVRELNQSQNDVDSLIQGLQSTEERLLQRSKERRAAQQQVEFLQTKLGHAAAELNQATSKLEGLRLRVPEQLSRGLRFLAEELFWGETERGLQNLLRGVSHHAELAAHFAWVMRSYTKLLDDDLPSAVEILGPNPSDEALAKYERLVNLTELYIADRESHLLTARTETSERASTARVLPLDDAAVYRRQKRNLDEVVRETKLGYDPPPGNNKFRKEEMEAALRIERRLGVLLQRAPDARAEWHVVGKPEYRVDLVRPSSHPAYKVEQFEASLRRHFDPQRRLKEIYVEFPSEFPQPKREEIRRIVQSLPDGDRARVVFLEAP